MSKANPCQASIINHFEFQGFQGCQCWCKLEIVPLSDGQTVVIATEVEGNPGTSVTNVAEHLASFVCDCFEIDPEILVWIEHYGYPVPGGRQRTYDRVMFQRRAPEKMTGWSLILRHAERLTTKNRTSDSVKNRSFSTLE